MSEQLEALRLAELCEGSANAGSSEPWTRRQAAAELRRLQSVETESKERILRLEGALVKEVAINTQLLEALETALDGWQHEFEYLAKRTPEWVTKARAAIAAAKGGS
jgi:hypothetical protein